MSGGADNRSWPRFFGSVALAAFIFLAIGPIVGTIAFLLAYGVFAGDVGRGLSALAMMALYFPIFLLSYALAWKAALAAGVIVALAAPYLRDMRLVLVFAAITGALASVFLVSPMVAPDFPGVIAAALALAGAGAAMVCAFVCGRIWRSAWPAIPMPGAGAARGESA